MASIQSGIVFLSGATSPEGAVVGNPGWLYMQTTGTDAGTLWSKKVGTGNTGWGKIAPVGGNIIGGAQWFVSPSGSASNFGTEASPWTFDFAKTGANGQIKPGDTVWLRAGTYPGAVAQDFGHHISLNGTDAQPITFRGFAGEHVILVGDSALQGSTLMVDGSNVWIRDMEIVGGQVTGTAANVQGKSNKLINCVVHDGLSQGIAMQRLTIGSECYGNICYNNGPCTGIGGCSGSEGAYSVYTQNNPGVAKLFQHNIFFNNTSTNIQCYGGGNLNFLQDITLDANVSFGGSAIHATITGEAIIVGGPSNNIQITNNHFYQLHMPSAERRTARLSADTASSTGLQVVGNRFYGCCNFEQQVVGGVVEDNTFHSVGTVDPSPLNGIIEIYQTNHTYSSWTNNTHYRLATDPAWRYFNTFSNFATWKTSSGLGASDLNPAAAPSGTEIVILPNRYESKRATVVIYNWALAANVAVNLASCGLAVGDSYVVRNAQNFYATPAVSGTYAGGTVNFPMAGITPPTTLYGRAYSTPPQTGPQFQVFVVRLASA